MENNKETIITKNSFFVKYALLNLFAQGFIVIFGVLLIPLLIKGLGTERFGILTLAWSVTGYFSIFDFGIGRAMTKIISEKIGNREIEKIPSLVWTGIFLMLIIGLIGSILIFISTPFLVHELLVIPKKLQNETTNSLFILSISVPLVISSASLRGILEAYQRFDLMNYIRVPMGALIFISPLIVLHFSKNIVYIIATLIVIRLIEWIVNLFFCFKVIPKLKHKIEFQINLIKPLIKFGSWITISNIVSPLLVYIDKFLISSMVSISAVTFYSAPFELNNRLMIIPSAIVGVLFSAFSATFVKDRILIANMFSSGLKYTYLSIFPIILIIIIFSREGLGLWLGSEIASKSFIVLQLLAFGSILNSLSYIPSALIQAAGRPDLTAKLNIIELPLYLFALYFLIKYFGIEGAAFAYILRTMFDSFFLLFLSAKLLSINQLIKRLFYFILGTLPILLFFIFFTPDLILKCILSFIMIFLFFYYGWKIILDINERNFILKYLKCKFFNNTIN